MTAPYQVYRRPDSGKFRHTLDALQRPSELDDRGQLVGPWKPCIFGIRANILPLMGRQLETASALYNEAQLRIEMPYLADLEVTMRLSYRSTGQLFHIGHIDNHSYEGTLTVVLVSEVK